MSPEYLLLGSDSPVACLSFARFGRGSEGLFLISGTQGGSVSCWSLKTRRVVGGSTGAHENAVLNVIPVLSGAGDVNKVSKCVITQGREGKIYMWRIEENGTRWIKTGSIDCQSLNFCSFALAQVNQYCLLALPSPTNSSQVDLHILVDEFESPILQLKPKEVKGKYGMLMDLCLSSAGEKSIHLLGGYENGCVILWMLKFSVTSGSISLDEEQPIRCLENRLHKETVITVDYCHHSNLGYSGSADGNIAVWSVAEDGRKEEDASDGGDRNNATLTVKSSKELESGVGCLKCRSDGRIVVVGMWDGRILVFGGKKLKYLASLEIHEEAVTCMSFAEDTKALAVGSKDKIISVWSLYKDV